MKVFIDSSAWIEYLEGSKMGEQVSKIINENHEIYSISLIVAEVISKTKRSNKDIEIPFRAITNNSKILDINPEIAKESGVFHAEMKKKQKNFGLADAIIWICAKKLHAKLITCDNHFKEFKDLVLLK